MPLIEIRVPIVIAMVLVVLGLPSAASFLLFGVAHLIGGSWSDFVPALVLCALGTFLLLMAIAAFRGLLHRGRNPNGTRQK